MIKLLLNLISIEFLAGLIWAVIPLVKTIQYYVFRMSGIYLELVFLDGFLNLGQSIFTLAIFGISAKVFVLSLYLSLFSPFVLYDVFRYIIHMTIPVFTCKVVKPIFVSLPASKEN